MKINIKLKFIVWVIGALGFSSNTVAQPEFVLPSGAHGCLDCHYDDEGTGFKPGVLEAFTGGIPGLKAFITKLKCAQDPTLPECAKPRATDTAPELLPIQSQWDVTVGEMPLNIPLLVSDKEDDKFGITLAKPGQSPTATGATLSAERTDLMTRLPVIDFKWSPKSSQANKNYVVNFTAQEKGVGRKLISKAVTANITVWPARTKGLNKVRDFKLQRAQWSNNTLNLSGAVVFKAGLTAAQRKSALNTLMVKMRSNSGAPVGSNWHLSVDATGNWSKSLTLPGSSVPCVIKLNYEGLNATSPVKLTSADTCLQ